MRPGVLLTSIAALAACHARDAQPLPIARDPAQAAVVSPPATDRTAAAPGADPSAGAAAPSSTESLARVERVLVERDVPAALVRNRDGHPPRIVFLPGVCSNAYAYLLSFPEAARTHGGVLAIDG